MKLKYLTMFGVILLVLAFLAGTGAAETDSQNSDDIKEYDGPFGSDHVAYGLKLGLQDLDEAFTFNENEKLAKKIAHLEERIAEYKAAIKKNNENAANKALEVYEEKMKNIEDSISENSNGDKKIGLLNAVQRIQKHNLILENLTNRNPDNKGLRKAYENSHKHLIRFASKHHIDVENLTFEDDEHEKLKDSVKIKAKTSRGITQIEIDIKFGSSSKENLTIANEIRNKFLALNKENITKLIKIENTSEEDKSKEELEAEADIKKEGTEVEAEYKFPLDAIEKGKIIDGIVAKLSSTNGLLTVDNIVKVLEIKEDREVKEKQKEIEKEELKEVKERQKEIEKQEKEMKKEDRKGNKEQDDDED